MHLVKLFSVAAIAATLSFGYQPTTAKAADTYALDKPHTQIKFSVNRGGWSRVAGWFEKFDGSINFDEADVSKSSVSATIQTSSLNTGFARRDKHLRSPDFFNAQEFPTMTFKSTKIEKTGAKTGKMTGNLTLLGVTKPVTLDVTFNRKAPHPRNKKTFAGFTAKGKINRADYGMKFILGAVKDPVEIEIQALSVKK
ncbi:MAG: polyisoprenoid-binding protein [Rhodospirillaceae bacterium]|jgi:polyisoprenoid-binding protein YceI|nr:polyisoprenoid-binding protein [Rhodospirillaceae bacterium]MBT7954362.1 polyisoprenoid-binding protein [Rhodospirillaceae bacterium]